MMQEAARQGIAHISVAGWGSTYGAQYQDAVHPTQAGHNKIGPIYGQQLRNVLR
ncbi:hypothetical protein [Streptomyces sp. MMS24-I29]|uniref:hypothetical protein n=1 Tax=Streptomyces sp. MMS24-I29 TaxID=3351480 RepID=UPI003C7CC48A